MKKRKTFDALAPADAPPAKVTVQFAGLPPESRMKLDELLRGWADWHADKYLPGYMPPETVSGSLAYKLETMHLAWEDKPAPPTVGAADIMWFNVKYEQAGGVPLYDRFTDNQLYYCAKKRSANTLLAAEEAAAEAGGAGKPVKRLRSSTRCFNCGSYGHSMRDCWKELNRELVADSKREHAEAREASGAAYRSGAKRYYLEGAAGGNGRGGRGGLVQAEDEFEGLQAGQLSEELRQALGIGPSAPPPWLQRMRELGLPPGYMVPAPATAEPAEAEQQLQLEVAANGTASSGAVTADPAGSPEAADGQLEDFIALEGSPQLAAARGEEAESVPVQLECYVQFPGINAPPPEGLDEAAWAPPALLLKQHPSLPPSFGSPLAAAVAGHSMPADREQRQRPLSGEHCSGSRDARLLPLQGLHPPQHGAAEGSLPAPACTDYPPPSHHHPQLVTPLRHISHRDTLTPDPFQHQPPQQQVQQVQLGWHDRAADQRMPPGFGQQQHQGHSPHLDQSQDHRHHQQQQQPYPQHQQQTYMQQQGHPQQQPYPQLAEGVFSVSRSDPGHLLVVDQQGAGQQAYAQQQRLLAQQQYWVQQQLAAHYQQQGAYSQQQPQEQTSLGAAQQDMGQPGGMESNYQQQLWMVNGSY